MDRTSCTFDKSRLPLLIDRYSRKTRQGKSYCERVLKPNVSMHMQACMGTCPWHAVRILVSYVDVFDGDLNIVNYLVYKGLP